MRVLSVFGNRPEFVKSAPLSAALREAGIDEVLVHTGQHYDPALSEVFFRDLGLRAPAALRVVLPRARARRARAPLRLEGLRPDGDPRRRTGGRPGRGARLGDR